MFNYNFYLSNILPIADRFYNPILFKPQNASNEVDSTGIIIEPTLQIKKQAVKITCITVHNYQMAEPYSADRYSSPKIPAPAHFPTYPLDFPMPFHTLMTISKTSGVYVVFSNRKK